MTHDNRTSTHTSDSMDTVERPRIIGIHGALERHEIADDALTQALMGAANTGATTDLIDLSELILPLYSPDRSEPRDAIVVTRCISQADAVLLATSVHHNTYSTQLKNALEYCGTDEFDGTPVGLLGVADKNVATALDHLRTICTRLDAQVLPTQVSIMIEATQGHDELPTDSISELQTLGQHVVDQVSRGDERQNGDSYE